MCSVPTLRIHVPQASFDLQQPFDTLLELAEGFTSLPRLGFLDELEEGVIELQRARLATHGHMRLTSSVLYESVAVTIISHQCHSAIGRADFT